jgi:L-rhamnose-H+ transport protein
MVSNPILGTFLHALGGISASSCYLPNAKTHRWSWGTFWLVFSLFAWFIVPLVVGWLTVPDLFDVLADAPSKPFWLCFLLGAAYGFGGMAFGKAITHIGYSLTYTLSIGISSVLGTLMPMFLFGQFNAFLEKPGSNIVMFGMALSVVGVFCCGWAGFGKEKFLKQQSGEKLHFNMKTGLVLTVIAGILSGVFNLALEYGQPIADLAAQHGAGNFEGNAKMIIATSGCCIVNLIWFIVEGIKNKTLHEFIPQKGLTSKTYSANWLWSVLAGCLWYFQFFFYGLGHVQMGEFRFVSWVLHMSMLIFFSYIVGLIMKEWKNVNKQSYIRLVIGLIVLVLSFCIMSYGSYIGESGT